MLRGAYLLSILLVILWCSGFVGYAQGETMVVSEIKVRSSYDDSMLGKGEDDGELLLSPSITYDQKSETAQILLNGGLDAYMYATHDEYRRENARLSADISTEYSERLSLRVGAGWSRDHSVESEYDESGLITEKVARNSWSLSPGISYIFDELDQLDVDSSFMLVDSELSPYADYSVLGGTVGWTRALSDERSRVITKFGSQHYDFDRADGDTSQSVYSLQAGWLWQLSERLSLQALGGMSWTTTDVTYDEYTFLDNQESMPSYLGSVSGAWTDEVWSLSLTADRSESPSSYGELVSRNRVRMTYSRSLSERLRLNLNGAVYMSSTSGYVQDEEQRTWNLGPTVSYALSEDSSIQAGYSYILEEDLLSDHVDDRNRAFIQFSIRFPDEW